MSKKRPKITARMKVDALLHRIYLQFGSYLKDSAGNDLKPEDTVVFDHTHALTFDGPHVYQNLRPALKATNDEKARRETRDYHHVRRLRGDVKGAPSRPLRPSQFDKRSASIASNRFGKGGWWLR